MQKKIFSLISILMLLLVSVSQTSVTYALENSSEGGDYPKYHFIQYNGEEEEIAINENLNIVLTGWTDESKTKVYGEVVVEHETSKEILLDTTVGIAELDLENGERFTYRLTESGAFNVREVEPTDLNKQTTVVAENENGTSIEEVNTMDDYNTLVQQELVYYKTDEKNQKVEISQAEYETINSTVAEQNPTEDTQQKQPSEDKVTTKEESPPEIEKKSVKQTAVKIPSVVYSTHVQTYGWMDQVADGETGGTTGKNKRMEAIKIALKNTPYSGGITYSTQVQSKGWMPSVTNGAVSGTTGQNKRLESIKVNLTGEMATHYDVYYRVHSQSFGWLDWAKNGQAAGTEGLSKRMEAIEIVLVKKGDQAPGPTTKPYIGPTPDIKSPSVVYSTHVQTYGWMDQVADGETSGTTGKDKRMEAIKIALKDTPYSGGITYSSHVQSKGWMESVTNGAISGTTGQDKRMEAIEINLTDEIATHYDVYYRVHAQSFGWLDWAKNGQAAGTEGLSKRMEAIEVKLVKKGDPAPGPTAKPLLRTPSVVYSTHVQTYGWMEKVTDGEMSGTTGQDKRMEAIKIAIKDAPYSGSISYSSHVQSKGWMSPVTNGGISGTTGQDKRIEAIEINLTGEIATHYDVYYRVHAQSFGWLGWARNGMKAGSEGLSKRVEAIEIKLVPKGKGDSVIQNEAFRQPLVVFLDPGHGGFDVGAVNGAYHEADLNLIVAKKVEALLSKRHYKVYMSRDNDTYLSLLDRSKIANDLRPDIFISIHHNSGVSAAAGIESYYYKYNPNYPPAINGEMHNNSERIVRSIALANTIQKNMVKNTQARDRGIYGKTFSVLRESAMPAALLELGFISNPIECLNLISNSYQDKLAKSIADGIDQYFKS
ncbi:N-acetylmuramoyl-L-alanine amidase [Virgibacillus halodenitrificans]|uniref:N-acetylmuramoyl-L-alanine amidase n=1 Tax=Virgibacillus halodenitrificans TaxID=1482 RepID=A0ABR7VI93_VIRHA|nr:N-acetylmuramoyl-L-alanine amidase [Virgibacillus halodenitrificans]MBD1221408.1 N-acetylmuramoyl-L-alanine amidase [Virgibacillus halodenitrificans]